MTNGTNYWFAISAGHMLNGKTYFSEKAYFLGWTCIYVVTAEKSDRVAEELYKPVVRYLRLLDEGELLDVCQTMIQDIPSCDYLFDEIRRKEGLSEKLGNLFHKK